MNKKTLDHLCRQRILIIAYICVVMFLFVSQSLGQQSYANTKTVSGAFALSLCGKPASILVNNTDFAGVLCAVENLHHDIHDIMNAEATLSLDKIPEENGVLIIGTIETSSLINGLTKNNKLKVTKEKYKWEGVMAAGRYKREMFSLCTPESYMTGKKPTLYQLPK